MNNYICTTCGTQFAATTSEPARCPTCDDPRQYIGANGQKWTTLGALQQEHHAIIKRQETSLTGVGMHPDFAIGQRALLLQTDQGNVLWDCISLIDDPTVAAVKALGGISVIAISHPHFFSSMVEWSATFNAPIYIHEADKQRVMRPHSGIVFWRGETHEFFGGLTLVRCGGHFPGSQVLHWPGAAGGKGALLTGDTISVTADRRYVSFMYSYPNQIPLPVGAIERIRDSVESLEYDRIYGGWWDRVIGTGAKDAVRRSSQRYIRAITDGLEKPTR